MEHLWVIKHYSLFNLYFKLWCAQNAVLYSTTPNDWHYIKRSTIGIISSATIENHALATCNNCLIWLVSVLVINLNLTGNFLKVVIKSLFRGHLGFFLSCKLLVSKKMTRKLFKNIVVMLDRVYTNRLCFLDFFFEHKLLILGASNHMVALHIFWMLCGIVSGTPSINHWRELVINHLLAAWLLWVTWSYCKWLLSLCTQLVGANVKLFFEGWRTQVLLMNFIRPTHRRFNALLCFNNLLLVWV